VEVLDAALDQTRATGMPRLTEQLLALKLDAQGVAPIDVRSSIDAVAESVHATRPDVRPAAAPDGTVTVMFSDIEDSTALNERLGDERWLSVLRAHNSTIRRKVMEHGGFEVKSQGDGFMLAFADPHRAIACAVDLQRAFAAQRQAPEQEPIHIRVGLHTGQAIRHQDDFFGKNVVLASRIAERARGDEILISEALKQALHDAALELDFDEGQELELKGLSGRHRVFAVPWQEADAGVRG
jgi:class 3 adenylate cyclase